MIKTIKLYIEYLKNQKIIKSLLLLKILICTISSINCRKKQLIDDIVYDLINDDKNFYTN